METAYENTMKLEFLSKSENEAFARITVASFASQLDPTIEQISDIKTAVSEAVTNAIIHGYGIYQEKQEKQENKKNLEEKKVFMILRKKEKDITVIIEDYGKGIKDIEKAMEPMYTTRPEWERSGMGFAFMEAFMDSLIVESELGEGTKITMKKRIFSEDRELFDE